MTADKPIVTIDLSEIDADARSHRLFQACLRLAPGDRLLVHIDEDPAPLLYPLRIIFGGEFVSEPRAEGPLVWSLVLQRAPR